MTTQQIAEETSELHGVTLVQEEKADDIQGMLKRANDVMKSATKLMSSYFALTDWIREKEISDSIVRRELLPLMPKSRVSEILRVSQVSPQLYAEFKERAIGFKLALSAARAEGAPKEEQEDFTARDFKYSIYNFIVRQAAKTSKPDTMPNFIRKGRVQKDGLEIEWKVKRIEKDITPKNKP